MIVVLNHPSWWDPMIGMVMSEVWPGRCHFVPIESHALARYRFFERLGFFGVEPGTVQGGRTFLRTGLTVAAEPGAMLWITAQGRFADPRERPVSLRPGIGHLLRRLERGCVVPMALEYPFWSERTAEVLVRFGRPMPIESGDRRPAAEWTARVAEALEETQDALAREAEIRDSGAFHTVLTGSAGIGGVYDFWRRVRATLRGERFRPEHVPEIAPRRRDDR